MVRTAALAFSLGAVVLAACSFDWDPFDPRLEPVGLGGQTSSGGGGAGGDGGTGGQPPRCGDGTNDPGEQCDDGGTVDGDGCDAACKVECDDLFDPLTGHCYAFLAGVPVSWDEALNQCRAKAPGWDLVAVSTQAEHDFLTGQSLIEMYLVDNNNSAAFWTGGSDAASEDTWLWSNGEPFMDLWVAGEPSNDPSAGGGGADPGEDCAVYLRRDTVFGFDDRPCDESYAAVCELTPAGS